MQDEKAAWQRHAYRYPALAAQASVPVLQDAFARASAAHVVVDMQKIYMDLKHAYNRRLTKAERNRDINLKAEITSFAHDLRQRAAPVWVAHVGSRELITHKPPRPDGTMGGFRWRDIRGYDGQYSQDQMDRQARAEIFCDAARPGDLYMGKYYQGAFRNTDLDAKLRARGIDTLIVTGIMAEECVAKTAQAALDIGYRVVLVPDLTMYGSRGAYEREWDGLERAGALFATSATVRGAFYPGNAP